MERVDNAHAAVQNAIQGLASIEVGSLNETEREHAHAALHDLQKLDEALAVRSELNPIHLAKDTLGDGGDDA